jgi:hypothetical protein
MKGDSPALSPAMRRQSPTGKCWVGRALLAFGVAVLLYAVVYGAIEHHRSSKGPWQVTFAAEESARTITINQPAIGITNVQIHFPASEHGLTNGPATLRFSDARRTPFDVPFGKCVFLDTVFLPGTVVFEMSGHQIQLMPRVLTIDGVEHPWNSAEKFRLGGGVRGRD